MADEYRGALGAFPYAFRQSESLVFRSYVVVGGAVTLLVGLLVALSVVVLFGSTAGFEGGTLTLSRAFFVVFGLGLVAPLVAPTLLVARRHRRSGSDPRYDRWLAVAGYLFVLSLYAGAVASMPETFVLDGERVARPQPAGVLAPVVGLLYAVPPRFSFVVPLAAALAVAAVHVALRE